MESNSIKGSLTLFIIFIILLSPLFFLEKGTVLLWINGLNTEFLDRFFVLITKLGDGITVVFWVLFIAAFYRLAYLYQFVIAYGIQVVIVTVVKSFVFEAQYRPDKYFSFDPDNILHCVDGVKIYLFDSFPSGHTATVFFIATFFIFNQKNKYIKLGIFILALIVGVSRIYLIQHFFIDVYFGMIIGFLASLIAYYLYQSKQYSWYDKKLINIKG